MRPHCRHCSRGEFLTFCLASIFFKRPVILHQQSDCRRLKRREHIFFVSKSYQMSFTLWGLYILIMWLLITIIIIVMNHRRHTCYLTWNILSFSDEQNSHFIQKLDTMCFNRPSSALEGIVTNLSQWFSALSHPILAIHN